MTHRALIYLNAHLLGVYYMCRCHLRSLRGVADTVRRLNCLARDDVILHNFHLSVLALIDSAELIGRLGALS